MFLSFLLPFLGMMALSNYYAIEGAVFSWFAVVVLPINAAANPVIYTLLAAWQERVSLSRPMGKPTICIGENKGADQLRGNREADQRLWSRYSDSTIPPPLKSEISRFELFSVTVQFGLCRAWSETILLVFPWGGSFYFQQSSFHTSTANNELLSSRKICGKCLMHG